MPIKPENKNRYPANWKSEIVPRIRQRSGDRCEKCKVPNHAIILRGEYNGKPAYQNDDGEIFDAETSQHLGDDYVGEIAKDDYSVAIRVVLTVAHLDHNPENCSDENLRHWCQRCHNQYDAPHRANTRRQASAKGNLKINFNG